MRATDRTRPWWGEERGAAAPGAVLRAAARGLFPPADGGTTVLAQPDARHAGVWAFTAHSVIFLDEDPARVLRTLHEVDAAPLAASMNPFFLAELARRTGRHVDTIDLLTAAPRLPGPPPFPLHPADDSDHPRIASARGRRQDVRAWTTPDSTGVLVLGRGPAGRWEIGLEVAEEARHAGLGRQLALAARHLVPDGDVVWAQQAAGNTRSIRAFQAAGHRPVTAEALLVAD
ncbi:GNAT family N-acetyltransferase [Streptomyces sp. WA1-19]|uniref:GNAT family N-acetyltransferase n=1 Tax=Streptomyces sp. WA1-19 TaxID=2884220 RepID=UPI001D03A6C7|nr:GNAT family N-acetyltransferase [Streptomyces sp. WA1-19]UDF07418.1 GNAT family N-acetyltransferase [Streptomyces sp. WA1-19]